MPHKQSVSDFHNRVVLTSRSFCWFSTNQIKPSEEAQFDRILRNQFDMFIRCFSFFASSRHIPERIARGCNGIGHILVPQTVAEHQLCEWDVEKRMMYCLVWQCMEAHRTWYVLIKFLNEWMNECMNITGPGYPLLYGRVGLSSKHFSLGTVWHFCWDVLHSSGTFSWFHLQANTTKWCM